MAYQLTPWGYEVDGDLPPLIGITAFDNITAGKWSGDARIEPAIAAASAIVRNHCGWHVAPNVACRATIDGDGTRSLWLPTTCLTSVEDVQLSSVELAGFEWSRIGQVLPAQRAAQGLQTATVMYHAGFAAAPNDLAALVANLVVRSIALAYGVTAESAGGVSVSYAQGASYASGAMALNDSDIVALSQYKVVRAHAT